MTCGGVSDLDDGDGGGGRTASSLGDAPVRQEVQESRSLLCSTTLSLPIACSNWPMMWYASISNSGEGLQKEAEVHNDDSRAIDNEIKTICNRIQVLDRHLKKDLALTERRVLEVGRKTLTAERTLLKSERVLALCPSKLELKRLRESHAEEDKRLKQQRIEDPRAGLISLTRCLGRCE